MAEVGPPDDKSEVDARALQLGGAPFDEESVMWWNFLGRHQGEVVALRDSWQDGSDQFGHVQGYSDASLDSPPALPNARILPRRNALTTHPGSHRGRQRPNWGPCGRVTGRPH